MKKMSVKAFLALLIALFMVLSLAACSSEGVPGKNGKNGQDGKSAYDLPRSPCNWDDISCRSRKRTSRPRRFVRPRR